MRFDKISARLSIDTLNDLLADWFKLDQVSQLAVEAVDNALHIRCQVRWGLLSMPVALAVKVDAVTPDLLYLGVNGRNLSQPATQELLRTVVRASGIDGLLVEDSQLLVRVGTLAAMLGCSLRMHSLSFDGHGIELGLADVVLHKEALYRLPAFTVG